MIASFATAILYEAIKQLASETLKDALKEIGGKVYRKISLKLRQGNFFKKIGMEKKVLKEFIWKSNTLPKNATWIVEEPSNVYYIHYLQAIADIYSKIIKNKWNNPLKYQFYSNLEAKDELHEIWFADYERFIDKIMLFCESPPLTRQLSSLGDELKCFRRNFMPRFYNESIMDWVGVKRPKLTKRLIERKRESISQALLRINIYEDLSLPSFLYFFGNEVSQLEPLKEETSINDESMNYLEENLNHFLDPNYLEENLNHFLDRYSLKNILPTLISNIKRMEKCHLWRDETYLSVYITQNESRQLSLKPHDDFKEIHKIWYYTTFLAMSNTLEDVYPDILHLSYLEDGEKGEFLYPEIERPWENEKRDLILRLYESKQILESINGRALINSISNTGYIELDRYIDRDWSDYSDYLGYDRKYRLNHIKHLNVKMSDFNSGDVIKLFAIVANIYNGIIKSLQEEESQVERCLLSILKDIAHHFAFEKDNGVVGFYIPSKQRPKHPTQSIRYGMNLHQLIRMREEGIHEITDSERELMGKIRTLIEEFRNQGPPVNASYEEVKEFNLKRDMELLKLLNNDISQLF